MRRKNRAPGLDWRLEKAPSQGDGHFKIYVNGDDPDWSYKDGDFVLRGFFNWHTKEFHTLPGSPSLIFVGNPRSSGFIRRTRLIKLEPVGN